MYSRGLSKQRVVEPLDSTAFTFVVQLIRCLLLALHVVGKVEQERHGDGERLASWQAPDRKMPLDWAARSSKKSALTMKNCCQGDSVRLQQ